MLLVGGGPLTALGRGWSTWAGLGSSSMSAWVTQLTEATSLILVPRG